MYTSDRSFSAGYPKANPLASAQFLSKVEIVGYGVLGTQLSCGKFLKVTDFPDSGCALVDPAGLPYVSGKEPIRKAGAASGSIYRWLGIRDDPSFPEKVKSAIDEATKAKYHCYGNEKHVIHVVGPDFRLGDDPISDEAGLETLSKTWSNLLSETANSGVNCVRLLPVSGGVFSAHFSKDMHHMTMYALKKGFDTLEPKEQQRLLHMESIEMCIFMDSDLAPYTRAKTWLASSI